MIRFFLASKPRSSQILAVAIGSALILSALSVSSRAEAHDAHETNLEPSLLFAGCTDAEMVTGAEVNAIGFGGTRGYTPRCLKIKAGATVTIQASARHPLEFVATSTMKAANPESPSRVPVTRVFTEPGAFGFFCSVHGDASGAGMAGVIVVEPADASAEAKSESHSPGENQ